MIEPHGSGVGDLSVSSVAPTQVTEPADQEGAGSQWDWYDEYLADLMISEGCRLGPPSDEE